MSASLLDDDDAAGRKRPVDAVRVPIVREEDLFVARQRGQTLAHELGLSAADVVAIATAISEVVRNILKYAGRGELQLSVTEKSGARGLLVVATDAGPGIADVEQAMRDGYSSGRTLGLGLSGARRLMDEFAIASTLGQGTTVTMTKWAPK